jgi:hypothetical protein
LSFCNVNPALKINRIILDEANAKPVIVYGFSGAYSPAFTSIAPLPRLNPLQFDNKHRILLTLAAHPYTGSIATKKLERGDAEMESKS